jgi:crotonobetainyl-CoA:carnitine CoA-transferase CaiB-like acyl-CoA transferase
MPAKGWCRVLKGLRVVEVATEHGVFAGYLLAGLGADVVAIEPSEGCAARRAGPFDASGSSLFWEAFGRGKSSVIADLETPAGRDTLLELTAHADVLIESAGPGAMETLGLGYDALGAVNQRLVHVSISPFGETGPKAAWAASDLTIAAASGFMSLTGDEDRAPVRISADQAFLHAGLEAVGGVLAALYERAEHSGRGQHIDVSALESFLLASQYQMLGAPLHGTSAARVGGGARTGPIRLRFVWPCRDGHVAAGLAFGSSLGRFVRNLMEWVCEEGFCDEATRDKDWLGYGLQLLTGEEPIEEWERVKEIVGKFLMTRTKAELTDAAIARRLVIGPVSTLTDVLAAPHFEDRSVFALDGDRGLRVPASFADFDGTRLPLPTPAPALGATRSGAWRLEEETFNGGGQGETGGTDALGGLKVLDLTWVMAGAAGGRILADYGATVVRVESTAHTDTIRTLGPFRDDNYDPEFSGPYNCANAGKLGLALNLSVPAARAVLEDLVRWADVVLESYAAGVMDRLGFGIEALRRLNPSVIVVSSSLLGQTGPLASLAGFGNMAAAIAGFTEITGWPDRDPAGPFSAYTDTTSPRFLAIAALAAVEHRRRTAQGVHVDLSQCESALHLLAPALLDVQVTGRVLARAGNDHPNMSPHAAYPAADAWLAIACRDDRDWAALSAVVGRPDLGSLQIDERRARREEIDRVLVGWSSARPALEAAERLQEAGLPAHPVQAVGDVHVDPQLIHRRYFREVPHPAQPGGTTWIESHRPILSRTPARFERAGPTMGQHNDEVLHGLLGYSYEYIAELAVAGALE